MNQTKHSPWWPGATRRLIGSSILLMVLVLVYMGLWLDKTNALVTKTTLAYGEHGQLGDLYRSKLALPLHTRPVVLLIHGGGWLLGNREDYASLGNWLAKRGRVALSIDYRLTPQGARWPAQAVDVEEAVWWLREHAQQLNIDPNQVVAVGGSAGGHLAAWLGTTDVVDSRGTHSRVNLVASLWGPWDLSLPLPGWHPAMQQGIRQLLGNSPARAASPLFFIDAHSAPTLFVHGAEDRIINPDQSTRACQALHAAKVACEVIRLPSTGHGFAQDDEENVGIVYNRLLRFINERGFPEVENAASALAHP